MGLGESLLEGGGMFLVEIVCFGLFLACFG